MYLSLSLYIYIYIYICISLSLYIYICIHTHILGELAVATLLNAHLTLSSSQGEAATQSEYAEFNCSDRAFLQKAVTGIDDEWGGYCNPEDARPRNITNTDSRLLAKAVRLITPVPEASGRPP